MRNKRKLPIVAYIHGGAFNYGNNHDNFQSLVSQGLVVININYRLGPYGFLHLEEREMVKKELVTGDFSTKELDSSGSACLVVFSVGTLVK